MVPSGYLVAFEKVREELGIVRRRRVDPAAAGWVFDLFPADQNEHTVVRLDSPIARSIQFLERERNMGWTWLFEGPMDSPPRQL